MLLCYVRISLAESAPVAADRHDPATVHTIQKALHFVSRLKAHLIGRGVAFPEHADPSDEVIRQRRDTSSDTGTRRSRFTQKQKEHAMNIMLAMDDSILTTEGLERKEMLKRNLRYEQDSVLTLVPARGEITHFDVVLLSVFSCTCHTSYRILFIRPHILS